MGDEFSEQDRHLNDAPFSEDDKLAPHQAMYRRIVQATLDKEAISIIADGPALQITLARPPSYLPLKAGAFLALALYEIDQNTRSSPHMALPVTFGTHHLYVDANKAAQDGKLIDLICAAAVIPPVFDLPLWEGQRVMDAGTCDNASMPRPNEGATLILLTRNYRNAPDLDARLYVSPSEVTPADKIDFTSRAKIEKTWEMGRRDGEAFFRQHLLNEMDQKRDLE